VILGGVVAVCLLLSAHRAVIFVIAPLCIMYCSRLFSDNIYLLTTTFTSV